MGIGKGVDSPVGVDTDAEVALARWQKKKLMLRVCSLSLLGGVLVARMPTVLMKETGHRINRRGAGRWIPANWRFLSFPHSWDVGCYTAHVLAGMWESRSCRRESRKGASHACRFWATGCARPGGWRARCQTTEARGVLPVEGLAVAKTVFF